MLVRQRRRCRLLTALVAVALVFAHVVGAYAHAAGHNAGQEPSSRAQQEISAAAGGGLSAHAHGTQAQEAAGYLDACDFMCNGGLAILAAPTLAFTRTKAPASCRVSEIVHLRLAASLERPPKSAVRA